MSNSDSPELTFDDLSLSANVMKAVKKVGYETPSPIQAEIIPHVLKGQDVIGQAQTGTGKTAAFALPLLSKIDLKVNTPQVLVLAPTRELAIQVSEAFQQYAGFMKGFHVLPIYGGQEYGVQLRQLKRGVHVVVGTPGRVMDHMRRGTLKLDKLTCLVLDEADEMLRMGFIDDVEWVLEQLPAKRQIALFSATMPAEIRKISKNYLNDPEQITIKTKNITADTIRQRYMIVNGRQKLEALTTILESMTFNAIIIFVRTKVETIELSEKLAARGYASTALNGDLTQKIREQTIQKLKAGKLDMLIATDVAARGLDVERISHVINYDIPSDPEAYTHRIGRTGRAGREGEAILFVTNREQRLLSMIERVTGKKIERMHMPTAETINQDRVQRFKQKITDTLEKQDVELFNSIIEEYQTETGRSAIEVAAALAKIAQGTEPFFVKPMKQETNDRSRKKERSRNKENPRTKERSARNSDKERRPRESRPDRDMERFRIEVGNDHEVKVNNIVGAIANEAGVDSRYIKNVTIHDSYSTVDLPIGMPRELFRDLKKVWVANQQLKITRLGEKSEAATKPKKKKQRKTGAEKRKRAKATQKRSRKAKPAS
ncbi:MAG: DEAD/DEAH box helicase [Proteobacteria bacterium]|nr:DEAD/DEAH box helicase [Pseudomonadota bacterium]NOG60490.1 DEAD/DEAH box helicase [Pseudomonadota bacterium]